MKISCSQQSLAGGLNIAKRVVPSRSSAMAVLKNLLLSTDNGRLKISATDLETSIIHWIDVDNIFTEGQTTVPATLISNFIQSLPEGTINLTLNEKNWELDVDSDFSEAEIRGINPDEFPDLDSSGGDVILSLPAEKLRDMIGKVIFAAAKDNTRPVLNGINIDIDGGRLTFATADGYRLAVYKSDIETEAEDASYIIPIDALSEVRTLSNNHKGDVEIAMKDKGNQIFFRMGDIHIISQLIEGTFPDYEQILPKDYTTSVVVDTNEMRNRLGIASVFVSQSAGITTYKVEKDRILISATSVEHGENINEVTAEVDGEMLNIAFNVSYILDALKAIDTPKTVLTFNGHSFPGVIRPLGEEGYTQVVMPMSLGE